VRRRADGAKDNPAHTTLRSGAMTGEMLAWAARGVNRECRPAKMIGSGCFRGLFGDLADSHPEKMSGRSTAATIGEKNSRAR